MEIELRQTNSRAALTAIVLTVLVMMLGEMFHATSKIEQGTIVQKNDSITTILIPDKR